MKGATKRLLMAVSDGHPDQIELEAFFSKKKEGGFEPQGLYVFADAHSESLAKVRGDIVVSQPATCASGVDVEGSLEEVVVNIPDNIGDFPGKAGRDGWALSLNAPKSLLEALKLVGEV